MSQPLHAVRPVPAPGRTPDPGVAGSAENVAAGTVNLSSVQGMFLPDSTLYHASEAGGAPRAEPFNAGSPSAAGAHVVSGRPSTATTGAARASSWSWSWSWSPDRGWCGARAAALRQAEGPGTEVVSGALVGLS